LPVKGGLTDYDDWMGGLLKGNQKMGSFSDRVGDSIMDIQLFSYFVCFPTQNENDDRGRILTLKIGRRWKSLSLPFNIPFLGLQPFFHPGDSLADFNDEMILFRDSLFHHLQYLVSIVHLPTQFCKGNQDDYEIDYECDHRESA